MADHWPARTAGIASFLLLLFLLSRGASASFAGDASSEPDQYLDHMGSGVVLSGMVRTVFGPALEGAVIEVYDSEGIQVVSTAAGSEGGWSGQVAEPGTYFLRATSPEDSDFRPQIWSSLTCEGCDPTQEGTPVLVTDQPVAGLDFYLLPRPGPLIFGSRFEPGDSDLELNLRPPCCAPLAYTPGTRIVLYPIVEGQGIAQLTYTLLSGPTGLTIDSSSGQISWLPGEAEAGESYAVSLQVSDGEDVRETSFSLEILLGETEPTVVSGNVTTVTEGPLAGLSFALPEDTGVNSEEATGAQAGTGVGVYRVGADASIPIPPRVTRLSEFFYTDPIATREAMRVTLPAIALPPGRQASELQLYVYTDGGLHSDAPHWVPTSFKLLVENDQISIDLHSSGQLMFVGLPRASQGPARLYPAEAAKLQPAAASILLSISCEPNTWYFELGGQARTRPNFTACTFNDPDVPMLVQIESVDSDHFWTADVTPASLTAWLVLARATASARGLPVSNEENIKVGALPRLLPNLPGVDGLMGLVTPTDGYSAMYLNAWLAGIARPLTFNEARWVLTHEYFHIRQARTGALNASENSVPLLPDYDLQNPDQASWIMEASANWFVDEVFDADDLLSETSFWRVPPFLSGGLNTLGLINYAKWPLFKHLAQRCAGFNVGELFTVPTEEAPFLTSLKPPMTKFTQSLENWGCNFDSALVNATPAALLYLDYQRASLLPLADAFGGIEQDSEGDFGESNPVPFESPSIEQFLYSLLEEVPDLPDQLEDFPILEFEETRREILKLPRNSAASFVVAGFPGNQADGQLINLVLLQDSPTSFRRPIKALIESPKQPPDFAPFELFLGTGTPVRVPYNFAGRSMPDLFVTVLNEPSVDLGNDFEPRTVTIGMETITETNLELFHDGYSTGKGRVVSEPPGIDCDVECSIQNFTFEVGTDVRLTAIPDPDTNSKFTGWKGIPECEGSGDLFCDVRMDQDRSVAVRFARDYRIVYGARSNDGTQFYALTDPLEDNDSVSLRNGIMYDRQLLLEGEIVIPDMGSIPPSESICGELQAEDIGLGVRRIFFNDPVNNRLGALELEVTCSNDGYRRVVDSLLTQQTNGPNCADNVLMFASDGFIYQNGSKTTFQWSGPIPSTPMKDSQCDSFGADGCGGAETLIDLTTGPPFCFTSRFMQFNSDGTGFLGGLLFFF